MKTLEQLERELGLFEDTGDTVAAEAVHLEIAETKIRMAIIEAVQDGDKEDALHYSKRWNELKK